MENTGTAGPSATPGATADILIVGTGHGGAQTAIALRQYGFQGSILMVGRETDLPYERPPLSKEYLAGKRPAKRLLLRPENFWSERAIAIRPGTDIARIDGHRAIARDGATFGFGKLVWMAGGQARRLSCPGADLAGVHVLRSLAGCNALLADLESARTAVIAGGGYIGLEAAAVLRGRGIRVTLVEAQPRLLARVAAAPVSEFYLARHREHGVDVRPGVRITAIAGKDGRVREATCSDGRTVPADIVIAGIGLVPEVAPLGLAQIMVDAHGRTGLADIYAGGDCATQHSPFADGAPLRIESVQNATDMARAIARHIIEGDAARPYDECPWFWSNQYDLRLQTVGLATGYQETVVRGDPATGKWSLVYLRNGAVVALDCINQARDYVQGKALILHKAKIAPAILGDASIALKDLLPRNPAG